jgi:type 1 glutamine amidotransferase
MKNVIFVTDGFFHPPLLAQKALLQTLAEPTGFEFQQVRSMEKLPSDLDIFSAMVIYIHHKKISEAALAKLDQFVSNGGGLLGVHSATASFQQQKHYFDILGGRFTGHGPVESFEVKPIFESNIFAGIPVFTVRDELYIHEFQSGNDVHFTAKHEGQDIPAVWTRQYGNGRVCYTVPGHTTASMRNRTYQKVLQRGLTWVCGE